LRLSESQVKLIDALSRELLENSGVLCYNQAAAALLEKAGAEVEPAGDAVRIKIPSSLVDEALNTAPSRVVLGARNSDNRLILDADEPRVRFGSGSETNFWLNAAFDGEKPVFTRESGSIRHLCDAAHLCDNLENLDFFIRCVNIQDPDINPGNKDVNKFLASLNNITKHVQAGLTDISALDDVIKMGQIIAGGEEAFKENPVMSFICCTVKSPLQIVEDTADTFMEISKRHVPVVVSSCPMAGATGPFDEFGMVALINAELLTGVVLNQLAAPGAPIIYGAVPVRTRLDNLNDMYGAPEFGHYNVDCAQMARFYGLPCYSAAGPADTDMPGIQATVEKMATLMAVPRGGAQYIHYAFGLLERTNTFSPEQAIMDDSHLTLIKHMLKEPVVNEERADNVRSIIREVMDSDHKTFMYHLPLPSRDPVYAAYPLEHEKGTLYAAHECYKEIMNKPRKHISREMLDQIRREIPGILPQTVKEYVDD
jgi:trimethylamine--corrinoid protein Co-methyltransferase